MWFVLASEIMFFTGLIGSYIVLRMGSNAWPNPAAILTVPLLAVNTFILIGSSVTMVQALVAIRQGNQRGLKVYLALTILLGCTFLGIKLWDYHHLIQHGTTIASSLFGSFYFTLTGFHGLHVLAGVVTLSWMLLQASRGMFSAAHHGRIEYCGLYWHFVDIVWILLFAILCLM